MRIWISLLILLPVSLFAQDSLKTLFIGNSYTYYNNMPNLVAQLASDDGNHLTFDSNTPGGYSLQGHSTNTTSLNKIASNDWDYVVVQEQSQRPSFPPAQVATEVYPYAALLNDSIKSNNACTETLFYMTWGRENGDQTNCGFYPPLCTFDGMNQRLMDSYLEMGQLNNATVSPVGAAWKQIRDTYPTIDLYTADGSHPSLAGSYLAACVFYTTMFGESTVGNGFISTLDSLTAYRIQVASSNIVLGSLNLWRIGMNDLVLNVPEDTMNCTLDTIILEASGMYETISWNGVVGGDSQAVSTSGNYTVTVADIHGCTVSETVQVSLGASIDTTINIDFCDSIEYNGSTYYSSTTLSDTFQASSGCDSILTTNLNKIEFLFLLVAGPDANGDISTLIEGSDSVFVQWGDGTTTGSLIPLMNSGLQHTYEMEGTYTITGSLYNNLCNEAETISFELYFGPSSTKENSVLPFTISPNPSQDVIFVQVSTEELISYKVINNLGVVIHFRDFNDKDKGTFIVGDIPRGIYILEITTASNKKGWKRFIKN